MKIITPGKVPAVQPKPEPAWLGQELVCLKCGAKIGLEVTDKVTVVSQEKSPGGKMRICVMCPTPKCCKVLEKTFSKSGWLK